MIFNTPARITQFWGENPDHYNQYGLLGHDGLDIVPTGDDLTINAIMSGVVVESYYSETYGNTLKVYNQAMWR